jgi:DNA-binding GntR family transcriptional regulator
MAAALVLVDVWDTHLIASHAAREHDEIVDALARGDAPAAQQTLRRHRRNGAERVIAALRVQRAAAAGPDRAPSPGPARLRERGDRR